MLRASETGLPQFSLLAILLAMGLFCGICGAVRLMGFDAVVGPLLTIGVVTALAVVWCFSYVSAPEAAKTLSVLAIVGLLTLALLGRWVVVTRYESRRQTARHLMHQAARHLVHARQADE